MTPKSLRIRRTWGMRGAARTDRAPRSRRRAPAGFTLVEILVALVILALGLLGMASSAAVVTRQVGGAANQTVASQTIANRLEKLRSLGCSKIGNDDETNRGVYEHWVPGATPVNGVLFVVDTVKYSVAGTQRVQTYTITVPC
jgi:prepilin-type N-terminal cleavage/methylation domain-containing protein